MEYEVGIDEAGRGPVMGPMVYACCAWPIQNKQEYSSLGFADSKVLTEAKRDKLFNILSELSQVKQKTCVLSSEYISTSMLSREKVSLNAISMESAEKLVRDLLADGVNIKEVYVDTVGKPEIYQARLSKEFPGILFKVSVKADSLFSVVSAASIIAKVTRDSYIKQYSSVLGSIGSGYPADPETQKWLRNNVDPCFGFSSKYIRVSWKTITELTSHLPKVTWPQDQVLNNNANYYLQSLNIQDKFGN
jgi:ribonuclease H2 subunit A